MKKVIKKQALPKKKTGGPSDTIRRQVRDEGSNRTRSTAEMVVLKGAKAIDDKIEKTAVGKSGIYKKAKNAIKSAAGVGPSYKKGGAINSKKKK